MASTQFVSSVTAGKRSTFGGQVVANVAQGIFALGIASTGLGSAVISDDVLARNVVLDFQTSSEWDGRLDFTPLERPAVPTGQDFQTWGPATVNNAASGAQFESITVFASGNAVISDDLLARNVEFDFLVVQTAELALHFVFSGSNVISSVGGVSQLEIGSLNIDAPASIDPSGFASSKTGNHIVSADVLARNLVFDFQAVQEAVLALHFNFGGADVVAAQGLLSAAPGGGSVENASQGLSLQGAANTVVGSSVVSLDLPARNIQFDFVEAPAANLPIQFVFGGNTRTVRFDLGLDSFVAPVGEVSTPPVITPEGFSSLAVGGLGKVRWLVYPDGIDSFQPGPYFAIGFPGYVFGIGFDSAVLGTPDIPGIVFSGMGPVDFGQAEIEAIAPPTTQELPFESIEPAEFGDTFVSNYYRVLENLGGIQPIEFNSFRVSLSPQYIELPFDTRLFEPGDFRVGFGLEITFNSQPLRARYGTAIIDHARIFPASIDNLQWGLTTFENNARALVFDSIVPKWGNFTVFTDLLIDVFYFCGNLGDRCGSSFSEYTTVENVNQTIRPNAINSFRTSFFPASVNFAGKAVQVAGFKATQWVPDWQGAHLIAHAIRYYTLGGVDMLVSTSWSRVKNAGTAVYPQGTITSEVSIPRATRLLDFVNVWGRSSLAVGGVDRVSRSPRGLTVQYGIEPPRINPGPFVAYGSRYLTPEGISSFSWGPAPVVRGLPIPTVTPWWQRMVQQDRRLVGRPSAANVTPQLWPAGLLSMRIANMPYRISHSPVHAEPAGLDATFYGAARIEDSTRYLEPQPLSVMAFSNNTILWHDPPLTFPPIDNPVFPNGIASLDMGDWQLRDTVLYPEGIDSFIFSDAEVTSNNIIFEARDSNFQGQATYGMPILSGGQEVLEVAEYSFNDPDKGARFGKPRLSPHTIWCRRDVPSHILTQAMQNHRGIKWCPVDEFCPGSGTHPFYTDSIGSTRQGPWFGEQNYVLSDVTQLVPILRPPLTPGSSRNFFASGEFNVETSKIVLVPDSAKPFRAGFATMGGPITETLELRDGVTMLGFGDTEVTDNGPRVFGPSGRNTLVFGPFEVQNFNRSVTPDGVGMTIYGSDTPPMVYHYPRGPDMLGEILYLSGLQWASHAPRWLQGEGFIPFDTNWTVFREWMRVFNLTTIALSFDFNQFAVFGNFVLGGGVGKIAPYSAYTPCVSPWVEVRNDIV